MAALDEAIRIARRWANREGGLTSTDMAYVLEALAALPEPDDSSDPLRRAFAVGYACGMDADDRPFDAQEAEAWVDERPALLATAEPDAPPEGDVWRWESDGDGPPERRRDQYIVSRDGLERLATFHGPDAAKNARLASCAPALLRAAKQAAWAIAEIRRQNVGDDPGEPTVYDAPLDMLRAAIDLVRTRRSR